MGRTAPEDRKLMLKEIDKNPNEHVRVFLFVHIDNFLLNIL